MQKRKSGKSSALGKPSKAGSADPLLAFIGARIREVREAADVSQDRFSFAAEIERAYYGSIERGKRNLTVATLVKIAAALNVDAGTFLPTNEQAAKLLPK
jgi:transcriptional regulator with XRE-family HTH domain